MTKAYRKGRRWEYEVRDRLANRGWIVIRAAGSKPIDLIAVRPGDIPLAVECKIGQKPTSSP
jgi:Holliday junction resolvase